MLKKTFFNAGVGRIYQFLIATVLSVSMMSTATASSLEAALSDDTVSGEFVTKVDKNLHFSGSLLHHDDEADLFGVGLDVRGKPRFTKAIQQTGLGGKLVFFDTEFLDGGAMALGGFLKHSFPGANLISFRASMYLAPGVVSFGDADGYFEIAFRFEYEFSRQAFAFVGIRDIDIDIENRRKDVRADEGLHAGVLLYF
jgi:hypothetical protein